MKPKNEWTGRCELQLKSLIDRKIKIKDIAKEMNRSESNVYKKCKHMGMDSPRSTKIMKSLEAKTRGYSICRLCNIEKPLSDFGLREKDSHLCRSSCRACDANSRLRWYHHVKANRTFEQTIELRVYQARKRATKKKLEFDITSSDILDIFNRQSGKCFYSGIDMEKIPKIDNYYNLSIDRVDSKKGYVKDNVVLCCDSVNTMKNSMPTEVFIDICEKIYLQQKRQVRST